MIVDKINAYLAGTGKPIDQAILEEVARLSKFAFSRQFGEQQKRGSSMRLSSVGRCVRQQAYQALEFEANGKEIDSRARMVFFMGDLVEIAVVQLAKVAGCQIQGCQADLEIDGVPGHPDGIIGEHLLEVKSMSSYSFGDFEHGELDEGYRYQCNAYMEALHLDKAVIVALNKDAGVLAEQIIEKDPSIVADIHKRIALVRAATKENLPPRPYGPNEKSFLPWQCRYCNFHKTCWPNAEKVLVGKSYGLKIKKETPCLTATSK